MLFCLCYFELEHVFNIISHWKPLMEFSHWKCSKGIGEKEKAKLKGIKWTQQLQTRIMDFKFNMDKNDDMYKSRYGMVVLAKSGDTIGCMYVLYKMDFKIAVSKTRSLLWGLFNWEVSGPNNITRVVNSASFHNFFRMKAIDEFYKEGIIDSINEVSRLALC